MELSSRLSSEERECKVLLPATHTIQVHSQRLSGAFSGFWLLSVFGAMAHMTKLKRFKPRCRSAIAELETCNLFASIFAMFGRHSHTRKVSRATIEGEDSIDTRT